MHTNPLPQTKVKPVRPLVQLADLLHRAPTPIPEVALNLSARVRHTVYA
jgi:hypothetical protein